MDSRIPLKLVIVGDGACGKSALLLAYTKKDYDDKYIPTVVDTYEVTMAVDTIAEGAKLKLTVVDTAGQEDFANIRAISLQGADVTILCYTVDNWSSLQNAQNIWVKEIYGVDSELPFVLVGNKADVFDKEDTDHVSRKRASQVAKKCKAYDSIQCSAKVYGETNGSQGSVDTVFATAIRCGLVRNKILSDDPGCCILL